MTYAESNYQGSAIAANNQASFTFSYLDVSEIRVDITVGSTTTTYSTSSNPAGFTLVSPNQYVTLSSHPADSTAIRIYRVTDLDSTQATFVAGSAISANDLNNNYTQILQASQESRLEASTATTTADTAKTTADTATTTANGAVTTANAAAADATTAVSTANTASTNATSAVNTANTASTNASTALSTANTANTNATTALNNSRESDGSGGFTSAISKANTAITTANSASSTATTASSNATTAVSTANTASTNASAAVTTANAASATATAAQNAVADAVLYTPVANVSSIPGSPSNNDYVEVQNSTGIQSFSPLSGLPSGFIGASGLTVRLKYSSSGSTWQWQSYFANDPEDRYFTKSSGNTNTTNIATNTTNIATNTSAVATNTSAIATKMPLAGGTFTGLITLSGAPTSNLHAATKKYVDDNAGAIVADGGNFNTGGSLVSTSTTYDGGSFD